VFRNMIQWFNRIISRIFKKKQDSADIEGDKKSRTPSDEVYPLF